MSNRQPQVNILKSVSSQFPISIQFSLNGNIFAVGHEPNQATKKSGQNINITQTCLSLERWVKYEYHYGRILLKKGIVESSFMNNSLSRQSWSFNNRNNKTESKPPVRVPLPSYDLLKTFTSLIRPVECQKGRFATSQSKQYFKQ